jgi:hypothetical protein
MLQELRIPPQQQLLSIFDTNLLDCKRAPFLSRYHH